MLFTILFIGLLVAQWIHVTLVGRDAWPFSHYPMFSGPKDLSQVEIFRVALETAEGEVVWWRSRFYRYPEHIGSELRRAAARGKRKHFQKYLVEVVRLIRLEDGDAARYRAVHIIRRTAFEGPGRALVIDDQTVATFPIEDIRERPRK